MMTGFGKNKHSNPFKPKNRTFFGKKQKNYPPQQKLLDNVFFLYYNIIRGCGNFFIKKVFRGCQKSNRPNF